MTFLHPDDVHIERDGDPTHASVFDADGYFRYKFPASWTDEQILYAVRFANTAHQKGVETGERNKAAQIRAVLGINDHGGQQ